MNINNKTIKSGITMADIVYARDFILTFQNGLRGRIIIESRLREISLASIAATLDITRERVRQIEEQFIKIILRHKQHDPRK